MHFLDDREHILRARRKELATRHEGRKVLGLSYRGSLKGGVSGRNAEGFADGGLEGAQRRRRAWRLNGGESERDSASVQHVKLHVQPICRSVRLLTDEMVRMAGGDVPSKSADRRRKCHVRQIAMYICHVALGMTMTDVGLGFGRDRSTVAHACSVVEDRRDDRVYDDFISTMERVAISVFLVDGEGDNV